MDYESSNSKIEISKQLEREAQMHQAGHDRFMARKNKQLHLSKTESNHRVIESAIPNVAEALRLAIGAENDKQKGRKFLWVSLLEGLSPETLAYIGLNAMMDCVGTNGTLTTATTSIGNRIETEVWAAGLAEFDKALAKRIEAKVTKDSQIGWKRLNSAKALASNKDYERVKWDLKKRVTAAMPVVNAVLEFSGIYYVHEEYSKKRTMKYIRVNSNVRNLLNAHDSEAAWQQPMFGALIVPPRPWASFDTGVYLDPKLSSLVPLVKDACFKQKEMVKRDFERCNVDGRIPKYAEAVNAIQDVPLKINQDVLALVDWAWSSKKTFGKFPHSKILEELGRRDDWESLEQKEQLRHVSHSKKITEKNAATEADILIMNRDLKTAKELSKHEKFWIGWNLDTRGRVYPVSHFNFHRDDHIKAMFLFGNSTPLCPDSDEWLMIHIANLGDFDKTSKKSLEKRISWFLENEQEILSVLVDPKAKFDFWSAADKPFQFLAACIEWGRYKFFGAGYPCSIAPSLDGSNSGVQHYSAASRSSDTGKLVNLVPTDEPQDVYQTLANAVNDVLNAISKGKPQGSEDKMLAELWLSYGVGRKELKTNCMTFVYSSRQYGFSEQLKKQIMDSITEDVLHSDSGMEHPFGDGKQQNAAANFLAAISFSCVQAVLAPAKEGMDFFQACAGALASENKAMHWRTPIGFPVTQKYTKWSSQKIKVYLYDRDAGVKKRAQISLNSPDNAKIDVRRSKSGVSPNIIHSMDSSHLLSTVLALKDNGIHDFMMIHDSFAVPCKSSWDLFNIVRETFIDQYDSYCLYQSIYDSTLQQLSDTRVLDSLLQPDKGDLDLNGIANSDFCFA